MRIRTADDTATHTPPDAPNAVPPDDGPARAVVPRHLVRQVRLDRAGGPVVSHRTAARLHDLLWPTPGTPVDVLAAKGRHAIDLPGVEHHATRGPAHGRLEDHVRHRDGVRVLDVGATLALLAPVAGTDATASAVERAIDRGPGREAAVASLRDAVRTWRAPGRAGPGVLAALLDEVEGGRLSDRWVETVAHRLRHDHGLRVLRDVPIPHAADGRRWDLVVTRARVALDRVGGCGHRPRPVPPGWTVIEVSWRDRERLAQVGREVERRSRT